MHHRHRPAPMALICCIALTACSVLHGQEAAPAVGKAGIHRFNFAPAGAKDMDGFTKISGASAYEAGTGFGWTDLKGKLELGAYHGDRYKSWESTSNLNLISRKGPDVLAGSYATGPATFALDLKPGRYEVWVLSGDWGLLECVPREPYRIRVEGAVAYSFSMTAAEFYKRFENPPHEDDLTQAGCYRRYVEPRFKWSSVVVNVDDGQLNVNVDCGRRDASMFNFVGDYAITDTRRGPKVRYTGALNAMVVIPAGGDAVTGLQIIDEIDRQRRADFAKRFARQPVQEVTRVNWSAGAGARGYTVFFPNVIKPALPTTRAEDDARSLKFRAAAGQYVPVTLAVCPLKDLGRTTVAVSDLRGKAGSIPADAFAPGVVRYVARTTRKRSKQWQPVPAMIVPTDAWRITAGVTKQFWLTLKVPAKAQPGKYTGTITLDAAAAEATTVAFELEVLPFKLIRPAHLNIGMTYFSPLQYSYFGETRFWKRMEIEFADMREHGMTNIQYTGIRMDDYDRMDKAIGLYHKAGFKHPLNLLEAYGAMCRIRRNGVPWETDKFHEMYVDFIREFLDESKRRKWGPIIIDFGDEFTNSATEEFGAKLAKNLKTIPGIITGADSNGHKEVTLMAPEVDIVAFNNGWAGPKRVNKGKFLLRKSTIDLIRKSGATPWLVNIGKDRLTNGYWFWRMHVLGIQGKMEWMYRGYNGMPFNSFDGKGPKRCIVYPGPDGACIPSLEWEWIRTGLDDFATLHTLKTVLDKRRKDAAKRGTVAEADAFFKRVDAMFDDNDMNASRGNPEKSGWTPERYDSLRDEAIDLIVKLGG